MTHMTFSVLVVCREALLREAILDAIEKTPGATVEASMYLSEDLGQEISGQPDIVVYVDTNGDRRNAERDAAHALPFKSARWLILSDMRNSPLLNQLRELKSNISFAPLNVSRAALSHLVGLAACGHDVRVDECRDAALTEERGHILNASLSPSQWRLLHYLAAGLSNKEIARKESATVNAVKVRVRTLLGRLNVTNRTQAAVMVAKAGLADHGQRRANVVELRSTATDRRVFVG